MINFHCTEKKALLKKMMKWVYITNYLRDFACPPCLFLFIYVDLKLPISKIFVLGANLDFLNPLLIP